MAQTNPYSLRIEESLMEEIKKIAKKEGRSVNKQIEFILQQYIKSYKCNHQ